MPSRALIQHFQWRLATIAVAAALAAAPAWSADEGSAAADPILVQRGNVTIRKSDIDAELRRIPEKDRAEFLSSARRVQELIDRMILTLELADAAKAKGVDKDPLIARRVELEQDKVLAEMYVAGIEEAAGREFDAKLPELETAVRETYLASKTKYSYPDRVMITELTFGFGGAPDAAKERADEAYAKIKAGADIGDLAMGDGRRTPAGMRRGLRGPLARADLDPEVAAVVFGAAKVGEVNPPVRTATNWTIVRVNERLPAFTRSYDEAKGEVIAQMRANYVARARETVYATLGVGQRGKVNEAAIEALSKPANAKN